ncbi:tRNA dihydrouridine(20/20a) synthase DusA [Paenalcaligenes hermetiae]|uniref:tRNA-dihydrouridine(20/20a) synthase n=2 Tax=Paenalcaligenes hermetiae TaxID=1157987 RepID=A0ABP9M9T0_9BURK
MIDVTDRYCRYFHRLLAPHARLYTEMITTGALEYGDVARHLRFDPSEHPVALQLGGSDRQALVKSAKLGEQWGYDEINLNCGCPSDRVLKGSFGAILMSQPLLVADCLKAMQDAVSIPVTVKHRLGLDYEDSYSFVRDFVGIQYEVGVRVFIVHARNAVLKGLSPKENRDIPPLRYDYAAQLKTDFPEATFVLNGGISTVAQCQTHLQTFDGVMIGRAAWHTPAVLGQMHDVIWPQVTRLDEEAVLARMYQYLAQELQAGTRPRQITKAMLGWAHGKPGARQWRRHLSDPAQMARADAKVLLEAWDLLRSTTGAD